MFNALLPRSLISPPVKAGCHFGIDPPLAANEKELCFLGLEAAVRSPQFFFFFLALLATFFGLPASLTHAHLADPRQTATYRWICISVQ